ncbi:MAG: glutamyl-tRNA reductase [Dehalococcoidales bacterium]|nr:glutamyl-tRNA reductase [Dehalococcoidales bacterium]
MHVSLVGLNHGTAPIAVREKVAISAGQLQDSLAMLGKYLSTGVIVSTCNRIEIYTTGSNVVHAEEASAGFLKAHFDIADADLQQHIYTYRDKAAVEHLFRVTSGLDSMIIGEFEILGQVKQALKVAEKAGMVDLPLRHMFQSAIGTGRRVREETGISKNALSVSSVAVDLAAGIVTDLAHCKMLVIGAGEAGRLVAKVAKERGTSRIVVANRSRETASVLTAALGAVSVTLDDMPVELSTSHIAVTCTGAPHWILDFSLVEAAMRSRPESPLVIIDIGVPRNVEPRVRQLNNVFLYNIDDLTEISDRNRQQREGEIKLALAIIGDEVGKFSTWWQALEIRPVVSALMQKAEDIRLKQLNKTLGKLHNLSDEERDNVEAMTRSIVTKILQYPIYYLKTETANNGDYAEIVSHLFQLNMERSE